MEFSPRNSVLQSWKRWNAAKTGEKNAVNAVGIIGTERGNNDMMLDFIKNIPQDLHPILIHFPIAFLGFSFVLSFLSMRVSRWNEASWLLLWVGGLSCIPASVSGVISHFPYEETELHEVIGTHQNFGILGTLIVLVLVGIRYWTRRRNRDFGLRKSYLVSSGEGLIWIILLDGTGVQLTYQYGINVRGVNLLLHESWESKVINESSQEKGSNTDH